MGLFDIFRVGKIKAENEALKQKLQDLHADEYWQVKEHLDRMNSEIAGNNITLSPASIHLHVTCFSNF